MLKSDCGTNATNLDCWECGGWVGVQQSKHGCQSPRFEYRVRGPGVWRAGGDHRDERTAGRHCLGVLSEKCGDWGSPAKHLSVNTSSQYRLENEPRAGIIFISIYFVSWLVLLWNIETWCVDGLLCPGQVWLSQFGAAWPDNGSNCAALSLSTTHPLHHHLWCRMSLSLRHGQVYISSDWNSIQITRKCWYSRGGDGGCWRNDLINS